MLLASFRPRFGVVTALACLLVVVVLLLLVVVVLLTLIYSSVESSCRPWCLLAGISSYLALACFVVRFCGSVWYLVRGIVL